jgi:hypothetical protein
VFRREQDKEVGCLPQVCPFMTNTQATQTQPYPPSGGTSVGFGCGCSVCSESYSGIFFSKSIDALQSPSSRGLRSMPSSACGVRVFIPNFHKKEGTTRKILYAGQEKRCLRKGITKLLKREMRVTIYWCARNN